MKQNDIKELRSKTVEELKKMTEPLEVEIAKLKIELINKKLKNTSLIKNKLDDLARILTVLNLKQK